MKTRPFNTMFLVQSLDGKISSGYTFDRDWDKDIAIMRGLKSGMDWYYREERKTDYWSLITDRIALKLGVDKEQFPDHFHDHGCILWSGGHLSKETVDWMASRYKSFILVEEGVDECTRDYQVVNTTDPVKAFKLLWEDHGVERVTIQSGGTLNSVLLRAGLIDEVDVFIAPVLVGGRQTPTLVDGSDIISANDLSNIKRLELMYVEYKHDFIRAHYSVKQKTGKG